MANWTNIPTDRIEPGKPIRAIDGLALRDNPIAIAEGASGAPKIREAAISDNSITGAKLNDGSIRSWIGSQSAGAVGTYAFVVRRNPSTSITTWGSTIAGSSLSRASIGFVGVAAGGSLSGTWRIMGLQVGGSDTNLGQATLALRIS